MATIVQERYTIADACNKRKPCEYASIIIQAAKSAELGSTGHIIMLIYNGLDFEFQKDVSMPLLSILLKDFLQDLDNHKDIWWGLANQNAKSGGWLGYNSYTAFSTYRFSRNLYNAIIDNRRGQSNFNNYAGQYSQSSLPQNQSKENPSR